MIVKQLTLIPFIGVNDCEAAYPNSFIGANDFPAAEPNSFFGANNSLVFVHVVLDTVGTDAQFCLP